MRSIEHLRAAERDVILGRLRARGGTDPIDTDDAEASVTVEVSGGAPGERYRYRVSVHSDGTAEKLTLDEMHGAPEQVITGTVDTDLVRDVFRAAGEAGVLADTAPVLATEQLVPDSMVMIVTIREGDAVRRVISPVAEPPVDQPSVEMADLPLDAPIQAPVATANQLRPVLDALHTVEAALPG